MSGPNPKLDDFLSSNASAQQTRRNHRNAPYRAISTLENNRHSAITPRESVGHDAVDGPTSRRSLVDKSSSSTSIVILSWLGWPSEHHSGTVTCPVHRRRRASVNERLLSPDTASDHPRPADSPIND